MHLHVSVSINGNLLQNYYLEASELLIGRAPDCAVVLDNAGVSRHHAKLVWQGDQVQVEDMDSGNGTFVNGERVTRASLAATDELRIGKFSLTARVRHEAPPGGATASKVGDPPPVAESTVFLRPDETRRILQQAETQRQPPTRPTPVKEADAQQAIWPVFLVGAVVGLLCGWLIWA